MSLDLHIETTGSGPNVLFIHGLDSNAEVWTPVIALLGDHTCTAVDLPGHGTSPTSDDPADYERGALLQILAEIIDRLEGPVVLVGHSLGGYLGMAFALTHPDALAGLVLVATGPGFRDPDARERWNATVRENAAGYGIADIASAVAFHVDSMVIDRLTELQLPIALVIGDGDKTYLGANDYMEKKLPHATRTTVPGARHYVMRSHPEAVADAVRSMTLVPRA
jgi:pimeloyl-ACP methyl ester carboxylesterase